MTIEQLLRRLYNGYAVRFKDGVWSVLHIDHGFSSEYKATYLGLLTVEDGRVTAFGPNPQAVFLHVKHVQEALAS